MFPVLIDYPELSPTRSAQYETAMKTGNVVGYLYDFYWKERRGLVQAPIERRGGVVTGSHPGRTGSNRFSWRR